MANQFQPGKAALQLENIDLFLPGPYQPGHGNLTYWIPGRKMYKASHPIPVTGANVSYSREVVMFQGGYKADKHDFYFGEVKENVESAGPDDVEFQYSLEEGNILQLPMIEREKEYFWRVDVSRRGQRFTGDVWNFLTF